jgi:hypothetical protein
MLRRWSSNGVRHGGKSGLSCGIYFAGLGRSVLRPYTCMGLLSEKACPFITTIESKKLWVT